MIFFKFKKDQYNQEPECNKFIDYLMSKNIKISVPWEPNYRFRVVVHHYIREEQMRIILDAIKEFLM